MALGALIVTTGLQENAGVAALLKTAGMVCAGQRMISAFKCCGVSWIGLVVEKGNKKDQRQLAQDGVLFFGTDCADCSSLEGAQLGLRHMADRFDRVFLVTGNISLFLPETLRMLAQEKADVVIPTYSHMYGGPVLLSQGAMQELLQRDASDSLEQAIASLSGSKVFVPVDDSGIILRGTDGKNRKALIEKQTKQLIRPATDVKIQIADLFFDCKLATLLHLIDDTRSVRQASELMQISYSTAWGMLNEADNTLDVPLILRKRGGSEGSGCELSAHGRSFLNAYDRYSEAISQKADTLYRELFQNMLD